ncbi:pyrroline-5-carboxylate reductase [Arenicella chitinivorans]|uniref:Pyrroline-5-carboxylate reductase n=2 Tax=Arenicella chitinivorans TaxID=1329800 RepID=A0A918VKK3_9GAMM|nr:pyrroline-5-carboxylate reductase [Arenicella chitinivorans]
MATSMIGGMITSGVDATQICVFDPSAARMQDLRTQFGLRCCEDNNALIRSCDVVVIAIKPQVMSSVLTPLAASFNAKRPLLISVVAGIRADSIDGWLAQRHAIVRVMPNTPALIGAGASGLYSTELVSAAQRQQAEQLLNTVGLTFWVDNESDIDAVTALSGSGPAYFMLFIESLVNAAVKAGLNPDTALSLAVQTAEGSAKLIKSSSDSLPALIDKVTSPGGTTEQAMQQFRTHGLDKLVATAFDAAHRRATELADELG